MSYQAIECKSDPMLTVHIDRSDPRAIVFCTVEESDEEINTAFETADMPMDDDEAAEMVNRWLEG